MQKLDIYIKDVNDEFKRVDLFKDEVVELNQNIKDFRDVSKVLSDYTQSFSIPASKSNNSLFRHYYNNDILDSFDARYKHECVLKLNGIDFKKGFVRLTDVNMKDNKAHSYKIQFFGSMASLKDIMGSDELSVLEYMDGFNHELSFDNVRDYFFKGANLERETTTTTVTTSDTTTTLATGFSKSSGSDFTFGARNLLLTTDQDTSYSLILAITPDVSGQYTVVVEDVTSGNILLNSSYSSSSSSAISLPETSSSSRDYELEVNITTSSIESFVASWDIEEFVSGNAESTLGVYTTSSINTNINLTTITTVTEGDIELVTQEYYPQDEPNDFPDLMYPFISAESRYYYDSADSQSDIEKTRNLYISDDTEKDIYHGLLYTDLKPAIKAIHVIKAIEQHYGLTFSDDFFDENSVLWKTMYLHCAKESGLSDKNIEEKVVDFSISELPLNTGGELRSGDNNQYLNVKKGNKSLAIRWDYRWYLFTAFVDVDSSMGEYEVEFYNKINNATYYRETSSGGNSTHIYNFTNSELLELGVRVYTRGGIDKARVSATIYRQKRDCYLCGEDFDTSTYGNSEYKDLGSGLDFRYNFLPKMKCLDFLKSIFKMFNLIGYFEDDVIVVKTLNDFYNNGEQHDVSGYVDINKHTVSRSSIFREINYEFKKPKSVFAIKSNDATADEFGNERYESTGEFQFDGGKYDVKIGFGKMIYEKFYDVESGIYAGSRWGYSVNESFSPVAEHPLLFCPKVQGFFDNETGNLWSLTDRNSTDGSHTDYNYTNGVLGSDRFYSPRNFYEENIANINYTVNLNFGDELYNNQDINENSLFKEYHEDYILNLYQPNSRTIKIKAMLPLSMILNIQMNSRLVIQGKSYIINSMKNNLETGKTELELITNNFFG